MKYNTFNFFELYGLADLIFNYLKNNDLDIEIDEISEEELISFYEDYYKDHLLSEFYTVNIPETLNYEYKILNYTYKPKCPEDKPKTKNGEYLSSHILSTDQEKGLLFNLLNSDIADLKYSKKINPFATSVKALFKSDSNNFESKLHKISSIVATTTRNKFSYYEDGYYSFFPELDSLEEYVRFISYVNSVNKANQATLLKQTSSKGLKRPLIQEKGNFSDILGIKMFSDDNHTKKRIKFYNLYMSFWNDVKKAEIKNIIPKYWYEVQSGDVRKIDINEKFKLILKEDLSRTYESTVDFVRNDKKNIKKLINFLDQQTFETLNRFLIQNYTFKNSNIFIKTFIKSMNIKPETIEIIKDFTRSLNNAVYYKAKEYVESGSKDAIDIRKFKLINDLKSILDRNKDILSTLSDISDFYKKHSIRSMIVNIDELLEVSNEISYNDFRNLVKIYFHIKMNETSATQIESVESVEEERPF